MRRSRLYIICLSLGAAILCGPIPEVSADLVLPDSEEARSADQAEAAEKEVVAEVEEDTSAGDESEAAVAEVEGESAPGNEGGNLLIILVSVVVGVMGIGIAFMTSRRKG